jgi:glycosyltransferase involved in cell wall biosynthesis
MISGHGCIRVHKMALPLLAQGNIVHLICGAQCSYFELYDSFSHAMGVNHYIESIKNLSGSVDVFHAHNEPSWFVTAVKEHCDVPVILDVHDSWLARMSAEEEEKLRADGERAFRVYTEERNNFQLADGLVFPSQPFAEKIINEFKLTQPYIVLPSYLPRQFYRYTCKEWLGGLVYEGRLDLPSKVKDKRFHGFRYCEYTQLTKELHDAGIDFHFYVLRDDEEFHKIYDDISFVHGGKQYEKLLSALTRHDWGLLGNIFHTPEWEVAFPNKLFEYIASCVPIVVINAKECGRFVREHGIGIEVGSVEELKDRWGEHRQCRINLIKNRQRWIMENHISELETLYDSVINKGQWH